jgi:histidyl-tRNA synthetase
MELLPRRQLTFQRMLDTIRRGYERFGFLPVETPVFEQVDVLLTKSGGETEKQIYFVQSTGSMQKGDKPELALRFDLTVPLARYVAQHERELAFPFRRYQVQRVYRGERNQAGRFREFYQCDIDVIGKDALSPAYDAEIPAVIAHVFSELKVGEFVIQLNNRKLLMGLLASLGVEDAGQQMGVLREIDKLDKVGREKVAEGLAALGLAADLPSRILSLIDIGGGNAEVLAALEKLGVQHPTFQTGLSELRTVLEGLAALQVPESVYRVNLAIARGLDYYTGTIYETFLTANPGLGSVCSGGRYENLASQYTKSRLPGVGISIGATRLFYQLEKAGLLADAPNTAAVLVTQFDPGLRADYYGLAAELRAAGVNTELFLEGGKVGRQMKYADNAGIPYALVMGPDEKAKGTVMLKHLASGNQTEVARADLVRHVRELVGGG